MSIRVGDETVVFEALAREIRKANSYQSWCTRMETRRAHHSCWTNGIDGRKTVDVIYCAK